MPQEVIDLDAAERIVHAVPPQPSLADFRPKMNRHERRAAEAQARAQKRTARAQARGHERKAYSISEFCWSHGISRATYYNLRAAGLGPDEMRVLGKILITAEAAAKWRKKATARSA